jgi:phage I-like protein
MVTMKLGFITDMAEMQFDEVDGEFISTIQAFPYGEYNHPMYGKITFDEAKAKEMATGVANKVRGQDLDIDYDHKAHGGDAAGWVKAAEAGKDALYLTVSWTETAVKKIREKAYRYFSPEFDWKWKHPQTQVVHQNVLFGGGITNRPFLKGILPINLSEFLSEELDDHQEEGTGMDPKLQRKLLGLPEDATDEQVTEALGKLPDTAVIVNAPVEPKGPKDDKVDAPVDDKQPVPIAASEGDIEAVIKLAEASTDPAVKALVGLVGGLHKGMQIQGAALALSEARETVMRLSQPSDGKMLSAGAGQLLQEALLNPSRENILKLSEGMIKGGIVPAGEAETHRTEGTGDGAAAVRKFHDAVEAKVTASNGKMDFNAAAEVVASEQPVLFEEYRAASYSFVENRT